MTGDRNYITPLVSYTHFLSLRYRSALSALDDPKLIERQEHQLLETDSMYTEKRNRYNQHIAQYSGMGFYINLLIIVNKIYSYHLENTVLFPNVARAVNAIKTRRNEFTRFILNSDNIKIYGAQLINYVFYLNDLGIVDLTKQYTQKFKKVFSEKSDSTLMDAQYESKIYGMTHFIIAASHYYKNQVNYDDYPWIIDYFEANIDRIIQRTENDVIAEVGVCMMLVNHSKSLAIQKIKAHLSKEYDPKYAMIKNKSNNIDFAYGEHRNILTVMLFRWPEHVVGDPLLYAQLNKLLLDGVNSTLKVSL